MRAMPVVVMNPTTEHGGALRGMLVGDAIGPLAQCRLDEALGFAIGLRSVGTSEFVLELQPVTRGCEAFRAESRTVICEHSTHRYAQMAEIADAGVQEGDRAGAAFIGFHLGKANARVVVDGDKQVFPSGADRVMRASGNTLAH